MQNTYNIVKKIKEIIQQDRLEETKIMGINYKKLNELELEYIYKIIKNEIGNNENNEKEKEIIYGTLLLTYGIEAINETIINGIYAKDLNTESLLLLNDLLFAFIIRTKKQIKVVKDKFKLIDEEFIRLDFPYRPKLVNTIRALNTSVFKSKPLKDENGKPLRNKKGKIMKENWWIVHISELPKLRKIFGYTQIDCEKQYIKWRNKNLINKVIINNQHGYLYGFDIPYEEIDYACSIPIKGAEFSNAVREGYSDGREHLFEPGTRKFPRGLLNKILSILDKHNVEYTLEDNRTEYVKKFNWEYKGKYIPRDYQVEGYKRILKYRTGIEQLATGAGKTILASYATSQIGVPTIFFVHTKFLLNQAKKAFEEALGMEIGQIGDGIIDIKPVTVAMVQTVIKAYGEEYDKTIDNDDEDITDNTDISGHEEEIRNFIEKEADLVFFDECQFVGAETFYKIANKCNAIFKIGLSATPYRSDGKDMKIKAALGEIIHKIDASFLIKRGILLKPIIKFIKIGQMNNFDNRKYQTIYREEIVENKKRNEIAVNEAIKLMKKGKSVLLLVQQIKHGEILQKMFKEKGYDIDFTAGRIDPKAEQRDKKVEKLYRKEKLALIASTIADEGLDIQTLDAIILCGGGKSPSKALQRVGRALRKIDIVKLTKMFKEENKNILVVTQSIEKLKELKENYNQREVEVINVNNSKDAKKTIEIINNSKSNIVLIQANMVKEFSSCNIDVVFATHEKENIFGWNEINKYFKNVSYKFVDKDYAYIIDFIDNTKYLFNHSEARRDMFLTEEEFEIYGWGKMYRNKK